MKYELRKWRLSDAKELAAALNSKRILNNLRDGLPFPYTEQDAAEYITAIRSADENDTFAYAIAAENHGIGSIGAFRQGNIHRQTAELGYYLAEEYWGQPLSTLSGGERQRVKLAKYLDKKGNIYVLDEPTTGLHASDVEKVMELLDGLVDRGNTVIVIEHNLDLIKCADHIIDLGPEGGSAGGEIVAEGTPQQVADVPGSFTGQYLRPLLERDRAQRAAEAEKH